MRRKACRGIAAFSTSIALVLSGCVTTQVQRIGADDGTDACRQYVVALDATGDYFAEDMAGGALIGAASGALLGALISGGKDVGKKALIGAAAGAAAGAAGGYIKSKMDQQKDKSVLYGSVMSDYERELAKIDEADLAFKKLVDCRNQTMQRVALDYQARAITADEAKARWHKILDQKANDLRIAEAMGKHMNERLGEYEKANEQMAQLPWDAQAQAQLQQEQAQLHSQEASEAKALQDDYAAKQGELAHQKASAAQKAKTRKELAEEHAKQVERLRAKQAAEQQRLQQKKAGKIPTSTAQTHIQSYQSNIASAAQQYKAQVAAADNPDGFEASVSGGKTSLLRQDRRSPAEPLGLAMGAAGIG